jgi:hypothetical protein
MFRQVKSLCVLCLASMPLILNAQQTLGGISGAVADATGAAIPGVAVAVKNTGTNLEVKATTSPKGEYEILNLPVGDYSVSFSKDGFKTESHTAIIVQGNRVTTVNGKPEVGAVASKVEVTATPLLNATDTTSGYVLDSQAINNTPLGTGSFTQLAVLSPGLSADFMNTSGSNAGFGNQAIWANGQRDTSNSFSVNGVTADNVFNGKSTSQVQSSRYTLNTGQSSAAAGDTQTNTSAYDSAGQALATPPAEAMQEIRVNAAMYDASQGSKSGAHIDVTTRSGTNQFHGGVYEYLQNTVFNSASFFRNASTAISAHDKVPALHYNRPGATLGGPIKKDKLFFFAAYQNIQDYDALNGSKTASVPLHLTDDRSAQELANMMAADFGATIAPNQINPAALSLFQAKIAGQYLIPTPQITSAATAGQIGYDVYQQAPASFTAQQAVFDVDYLINSKDRLAQKYIYQTDPSTAPFGGGATLGFPKAVAAGTQTGALDNTVILGPSLTWEQRAGINRQYDYSATSQQISATDVGINAFGTTQFPALSVSSFTCGAATPALPCNAFSKSFSVGPSGNFANTGFYQNMASGSTVVNWLKGRHTVTAGLNFEYFQLNIVNNTNNTPTVAFSTLTALMTGNVTPSSTNVFYGQTNRYFRLNQLGSYLQDNIRVTPNLTLNLGVRYDYDGPLTEKYGRLSNFHPDAYQYNSSSDAITATGLVVAGNNPTIGTSGVNNSTLNGRQWGIGPRIGIVWSPPMLKNVVIRAGYGVFYDRGEYFSELSPSAGAGVNGPFGVTVAAPFVQKVSGTSQGTLSQPFLGAVVPPDVTNQTLFAGLVPNKAAILKGGTAGQTYTFAGYDPANVLPYTENWSFDVQWQPVNSMQVSIGYVGNHGQHEVIPIPFNQPGIATASNPINGETTSYGFNVIPTETAKTYDGGNTDLRVPYLGFNTNSAFYKAEAVSNYNALQVGVTKRLSRGVQFTASYTWSHTLDMQSGLGLFFNGNDPFNLHNSYGTSSYDRTHVWTFQYHYDIPGVGRESSALGKIANGWAFNGITVLQSGQPYDGYDFSGAVGGIYYAQFVEILDPVMPIKPGVTVKQVELQGTTGIDPNKPLLNSADFYVPQITPGTMGVPCTTVNGAQACDTFETSFGATGRNIFRGPFQERFDLSVVKVTKLTERISMKFQADVLNIFNHPSFDVPSNSISQYSVSSAGVPTLRTPPATFGFIQHTLGSPRTMQFGLHLSF